MLCSPCMQLWWLVLFHCMMTCVSWKCKDYWLCCVIVQLRVFLRRAAFLCCFDSCDWLAQVTIRVKWGVFIGWVFITWLLWYNSFKWKLWQNKANDEILLMPVLLLNWSAENWERIQLMLRAVSNLKKDNDSLWGTCIYC